MPKLATVELHSCILLLPFHSACCLSNSGGFHAIKATNGRSLGGGVAYIHIYIHIYFSLSLSLSLALGGALIVRMLGGALIVRMFLLLGICMHYSHTCVCIYICTLYIHIGMH